MGRDGGGVFRALYECLSPFLTMNVITMSRKNTTFKQKQKIQPACKGQEQDLHNTVWIK